MDAKIQPNARNIRQIRNIYVSGSEMQRLRYPACNRKKGTQDVAGLGSRTPRRWQRWQSVILQGVRVKYTSFCRRELSFQIFRVFQLSSFPAFQHILWRKRRYGAGRDRWLVLRCWEERLVGWFCKKARPVLRTHRTITINNEPAGRLGGDAGPATISAPSVSGRRQQQQRDCIRCTEQQLCGTHQHS